MSQQINLFNPLFLRQKRYFSAWTMVQALGIIVVALGAMYAVVLVQMSALDAQRVATETQGAETRARLAELTAQTKGRGKSAALADELRRAENALKEQQLLLEALRDGSLGDTGGFSSYLTAFARRPLEGLWLTGVTVSAGGTTIDLSGRAVRPELVPAYIQMLNGEPALRGRAFGELRLSVREATPEAGSKAQSQPPAHAVRLVEFTLKGVRADAKSGRGS